MCVFVVFVCFVLFLLFFGVCFFWGEGWGGGVCVVFCYVFVLSFLLLAGGQIFLVPFSSNFSSESFT